MRAYHLSILGLDASATSADIKAAYRQLSKKYHPDINKSTGAEEQFIQIKDAYEYLTAPLKVEEPSTSFHDELSEQELWRMEYRRRAREKELENQRLQQQLIKKLLSYFKPVVIAIFTLNMLLAIDYFLPLQSHEQKILGISKIFESSSSRYGNRNAKYRYDEMYFEDFTMRFDRGEMIIMDHYDRAVVEATLIFSKPMFATITIDGEDKRHKQIYNIYYVFGYLIPFMIALGILFFRFRNPMQKLNLAIVLGVLAMIQVFLYFM